MPTDRASVTAGSGATAPPPDGLPTLVSSGPPIPAPAFAATDAGNKTKPENLIPLYDGTSDPRRWLATISDLVTLGKWSEDFTVRLMSTKLSGVAKTFIERSIQIGETATFDKFGTLLRSRFQPQSNLITRLVEFRNARQEPREQILDFASRLRMLGFDSCTSAAEVQTLGGRLIAYFLHGLHDKHIRDVVLIQKPQSFEDAIALAAEAKLESGSANPVPPSPSGLHLAQFGRSDPGSAPPARPGRGSMNRERRPPGGPSARYSRPGPSTSQQPRPPPGMGPGDPCAYCKIPGHHRGICRKRLIDEGKCLKCRRSGHFSRECPDGPARVPGAGPSFGPNPTVGHLGFGPPAPIGPASSASTPGNGESPPVFL